MKTFDISSDFTDSAATYGMEFIAVNFPFSLHFSILALRELESRIVSTILCGSGSSTMEVGRRWNVKRKSTAIVQPEKMESIGMEGINCLAQRLMYFWLVDMFALGILFEA